MPIAPTFVPGVSGTAGLGAFRSGLYLTSPAYAVTTGAMVLNRVQTFPLSVSESVQLDRIGLEITTGGTAGAVVRLGIYADDGSRYPGALLVDAGTVDSTTTGFKEAIISESLSPGLYWLAAVSQVATATARLHSPVPHAGATTALTVTANLLNGYQETGVSGALPATFSSALINPSGGALPRVLVRAA